MTNVLSVEKKYMSQDLSVDVWDVEKQQPRKYTEKIILRLKII